MLMYVIVAVVVVLAAGLVFLLDRALKAIEKGRRRREAGMRLYNAARAALAAEKQRIASLEASNKLTSVLPAIQSDDHAPRKVA
jgi:hypothetical protein